MVDARELLGQMEAHWALEAGKPLWEIQEMLLLIGLAHLAAVKQGQEMGKEMVAKFKEARWAPLKEASRN